jgi:serine/threonine protein kinase/Tol biopolymer transport system component
MALHPGQRLGPYEVVAPLGAGSMGEVYRARDARLGREVAIKVLPAEVAGDPDRLRRFEQEARAIGRLAHPSVLAVHDVGVVDGLPYVVTELLEGRSLRSRLEDGPIPPRKALEWGRDIAKGLAAAHEKGVVHRDVKPENLFLTTDGRLKVLDFGLAKVAPVSGFGSSPGETPTFDLGTTPGMLLGTVGYMAPEQVRGEPADARSDVFAFGAVLYEMLSGRRAFATATAIETLHAILKDEPLPIGAATRGLPPGVERIVARCLEKEPSERFGSMKDLAYALEALAGSGELPSEILAPPPAAPARSAQQTSAGSPRRRRIRFVLVALFSLAAGALVGGRLGLFSKAPPPPAYQQLTFGRGTVYTARFTPDEGTILYSAAWNGRPKELFSTSLATRESRPFGLLRHDVVGASPDGEMAVILRPDDGFAPGTLARISTAGGAPRPIAEGIAWADWSGGGDAFVTLRGVEGRNRIEFPSGRILYESANGLSTPRLSRDRKRIAFLEHPRPADDSGGVMVVDVDGTKRALSEGWFSIEGVGWSPDGTEVWFSASKEGLSNAIWAIPATGGKERLLARAPGRLVLHDVGKDGRILAEQNSFRVTTGAISPADGREREVSLFDFGVAADLSKDGRTILLNEAGNGSCGRPQCFLRPADGGPATRLGEGLGFALSADGRFALVHPGDAVDAIDLVPTGAGSPKRIPLPGLEPQGGGFLPDGSKLVLFGREPGREPRLWLVDSGSGERKALSPEGVSARTAPVSPDGRRLVGRFRGEVVLLPVEGGEPVGIVGAKPGDVPVGWGSDSRSIFVREAGAGHAARIVRLDLAGGRRTFLRELAPADPAGVLGIWRIHVRADGAAVAWSWGHLLSDLFSIDLGRR